MRVHSFISRELAQTLRRPGRVFNLFRPSRLREFLAFQRLRAKSKDHWAADSSGTSTRRLASYEDYLELQKSKLGYLDLAEHERRFRRLLGERLSGILPARPGCRVLCLGARLGAEVAAFRDRGCFAFGIDLNPGKDNPWVLYGDFHRLQYPDGCVDIVYSNSLDHCLEMDRVLAEIRRVLANDGRLIVEADPGEQDEDGAAPDMWATFQWKTVQSLVGQVERCGFEVVGQSRFEYPRNGYQILFAKSGA